MREGAKVGPMSEDRRTPCLDSNMRCRGRVCRFMGSMIQRVPRPRPKDRRSRIGLHMPGEAFSKTQLISLLLTSEIDNKKRNEVNIAGRKDKITVICR